MHLKNFGISFNIKVSVTFFRKLNRNMWNLAHVWLVLSSSCGFQILVAFMKKEYWLSFDRFLAPDKPHEVWRTVQKVSVPPGFCSKQRMKACAGCTILFIYTIQNAKYISVLYMYAIYFYIILICVLFIFSMHWKLLSPCRIPCVCVTWQNKVHSDREQKLQSSLFLVAFEHLCVCTRKNPLRRSAQSGVLAVRWVSVCEAHETTVQCLYSPRLAFNARAILLDNNILLPV